MVDEDFAMGYAVGYNDGAQSGGGSDRYGYIPICKKYHLIGTDCYVAISDANSDSMEQPYSWTAYSDGDDPDHVDRMKWYPAPTSSYRNLYIVWYMGSKAVGMTIPVYGFSTTRGYRNTEQEQPYGDFVLTGEGKYIVDSAMLSINEKIYQGDEYTTTIHELVLNIVSHYEEINEAGEITKRDPTNSSTVLLNKKMTVYSDGRIYKYGEAYHKVCYADCSSNFTPITAFRDTLQAWFDCTGIEEV